MSNLPLNKISYRSVGYDCVPVNFIFSDLDPSSILADEKSFPRVNLNNGKYNGHTDLFIHSAYRGQHVGSGRHLMIYPYIIKGAGLSLAEHANRPHHSSGLMTGLEACREFTIAMAFKDQSFCPHYHALGKYNSNDYFIVRSAHIPRIAQVKLSSLNNDEKDALKKLITDVTNTTDSQELVHHFIHNLFSCFHYNLTHNSINIHNVNILGQYLDLDSFRMSKNHVYVEFWKLTNGSHGHLQSIKIVMEEIFKIYKDILKLNFNLKEAVQYSLTLNDLNDNAKLFLKIAMLDSEQAQKTECLKLSPLSAELPHATRYAFPSSYIQTLDISLSLLTPEMMNNQQSYAQFIEEIQRHQNE